MENFNPVSALIGGALIGTAAALFVLLYGRITGISGILGGLLAPTRNDVAWRIAFLAGLLAAPFAYAAVSGELPQVDVSASVPLLILGGLLVGFGTRLGAGCTSGHGVCGIARRSPRSLVATAVFMTSAIATVFVTRYVTGL